VQRGSNYSFLIRIATTPGRSCVSIQEVRFAPRRCVYFTSLSVAPIAVASKTMACSWKPNH